MKLVIDTDIKTLEYETSDSKKSSLDLYSKESFELISEVWAKVGWDQKYEYTFSWMGRPIIQLPEDMLRTQEVIWQLKPDVIVETGVAHGGSLIYYASLCKAFGKGRIIGVDIELRLRNRKAIEDHEMFPYITLIEGSSIDAAIVDQVKSLIKKHETVLVILDSNHTKKHVADELEAYHGLVSTGSYIVATDGIMKNLSDVPGGTEDWNWNNPYFAAREFASSHPDFTIEQPMWLFNESDLTNNITHWPGAWLKRNS